MAKSMHRVTNAMDIILKREIRRSPDVSEDQHSTTLELARTAINVMGFTSKQAIWHAVEMIKLFNKARDQSPDCGVSGGWVLGELVQPGNDGRIVQDAYELSDEVRTYASSK